MIRRQSMISTAMQLSVYLDVYLLLVNNYDISYVMSFVVIGLKTMLDGIKNADLIVSLI